jgi:hypothetical protein
VRTLALIVVAFAACGRRHDDTPGWRAAERAPAPKPAPCNVTIAAVKGGTWIALGEARRFVARCGHAIDMDGAARELASFRLAIDDPCPPTVEITGAPGADFEDLLASADAARMGGFSRIGMSSDAELAAAFPAEPAARDVAPPDCPTEPPPPRDPRAVSDDLPRPLSGRATRGDAGPRRMAVVSIDAETISVDGKPVAATTASTLGLIPELSRALPAPAPDLSIAVVADRHADAALVLRVVRTIAMSGHKDLAFALRDR